MSVRPVNGYTDQKQLQREIYRVLSPALKNREHTEKLLGTEAMKEWVKVFTHRSINANPNQNYDVLEFYGDKALGLAFAMHLLHRFQDQLDQAQASILHSKYLSTDFQSQLAVQLGLDVLIRYDPSIPKVNIKIKEDVLEAFFGCLCKLADSLLQNGLGYIYCYNLLDHIFNPIKIDLATLQKDPVTRLKEIYDKMAWGEPSYNVEMSDNPQFEQMSIIRQAQTGVILGKGYGSIKSRAEEAAAEEALKTLSLEGITAETANNQKMERQRANNPDYDHQYQRVEKAIEDLNESAAKAGKVKIIQFNVSTSGNGNGSFSSFLKVAFMQKGALVWRDMSQAVGSDSNRTKIEAMKKFADARNIPQ